MSKASWTPGPWRACKDGACVCGHIWAEGDKHVATVHENTRDGDGTVHAEWSREERVANARLIAAAPRLAEALEAWLAWAAKHQADLYFSDLPESPFTQVGDLVATSRAALARVKDGER